MSDRKYAVEMPEALPPDAIHYSSICCEYSEVAAMRDKMQDEIERLKHENAALFMENGRLEVANECMECELAAERSKYE